MSTHLVFVYGSLKEGFGNHAVLSDSGATFMGAAETVSPDFIMTHNGWYPYVMADTVFDGPAKFKGRITGEVYEVDDACLAELDRLEGHPRNYERKQTLVRVEDDMPAVICWMYLTNEPRGHWIVHPVGGVLTWVKPDDEPLEAEDAE